MASSGTFAASSGVLRLEIDWRVVSTDVAKNQSVVEAKVYMRTRWAIYWSANRTGSVTVNGTRRTYTHGNVNTVNYERKLMTTEEFTVGHNNDGTKSVAMSATFPINFTYDGNYYEDISISGTATLDAIPRATTMSAASFSSNLSPSNTRTLRLTLSINSTSFRHDVILKDGTHEIKKVTNQSSPTSISLTTTDVNNIINRMSTVTTKNFTVEVITKTTTNGTVIGNVSRSVRATLNNSTTSPTVSSRSATVRGSGYDSTLNLFVRTISRANVSFTANAGYGASISSMSATINNGGTVSGSRSGSTWTGTTGTFSNSGTYTVTLSVTNSRNQTLTSTQTISISVRAYSRPTIETFRGSRNSSPATTITLNRRVTWDNLGSSTRNNLDLRIHRKLSSSSSWSEINTQTATSGLVTSDRTSTNNAVTSSYDFRLTVTDKFGNSATSVITIGTSKVLMSYNKDIGVGIGKIHERGALDVQGDMYVNGVDVTSAGLWHANLENGWTNYGWGPVGCYKVGGIVYLAGMVTNSDASGTIFTLPVGYRPESSTRIFSGTIGASRTRRIDVRASDGAVRFNNPSESIGWISLAGISFFAGG